MAFLNQQSRLPGVAPPRGGGEAVGVAGAVIVGTPFVQPLIAPAVNSPDVAPTADLATITVAGDENFVEFEYVVAPGKTLLVSRLILDLRCDSPPEIIQFGSADFLPNGILLLHKTGATIKFDWDTVASPFQDNGNFKRLAPGIQTELKESAVQGPNTGEISIEIDFLRIHGGFYVVEQSETLAVRVRDPLNLNLSSGRAILHGQMI